MRCKLSLFISIIVFTINNNYAQVDLKKDIAGDTSLLIKNEGDRLDFSDNKFYSSAYWASFCFGTTNFGPTLGGNVNYAFENNIFSIRYLKADEVHFNIGGPFEYDRPELRLIEIGILFAKSYRKEFLTLSAAGGIAFMNATDRGNKIEEKKYEKISISTIGFPFEVKFRFEFGQTIGIGGTWFGNLNGKKSFTGGMLEISIGNFR